MAPFIIRSLPVTGRMATSSGLFLDMWNDPDTKRLFRLSTEHTPKPYSIRNRAGSGL